MLPFQLSNGCRLRLLEEPDADELYALIDANRARLARWMPWPAGQTLEGTLQFIRITRLQSIENNGFQAAILCGAGIAGMVGFHGVDWLHRTTRVGYWLGERHQGKGTMTAAVRALVGHALHTWQLNRVELLVAPENSRSRAVAERVGFREEGVLRQALRSSERYLDAVVYAVLASEWESDYSAI